jgi:XPG I-region
MGVTNFLAKVSEASGRPMMDLTEYARIVAAAEPTAAGGGDAGSSSNSNSSSEQQHQHRRRRTLRIGVDISTWLHRATNGKSDMLADERFLDNYGRAELLQQQQQQQQEQQQGMTEQQQEEQQQQQEQQHEQQRIENELREHLYIQACTKYVVDRLMMLQNGGRVVGGGEGSNDTEDEALFSILVVVDGSTPPCKRKTVNDRSGKRNEAIQQRDEAVVVNDESEAVAADALLQRRLKGFRRAGAGSELFTQIVDCVIHAMRMARICFLVAPYEADGQLAYLASHGWIDLIVTEDSDLMIASYASRSSNCTNAKCPILYKLMLSLKPHGDSSTDDIDESDNKLRGMLIRSDDLGSQKVTTLLNAGKSGSSKGLLNLTDFTPAMMAVLFVAAGCDYCPSLQGIGIGTASMIVRDAFLTKHHHSKSPPNKKMKISPLERALADLYSKCYNRERERLKKDAAFKEAFERKFLAAIVMFRHPTVYDPMLACCRTMNLNDDNDDSDDYTNDITGADAGGDAELLLYPPYAQLVQNAKERQESIVGNIISPPTLATYIAEGWVSPRSMKLRSTYTTSTTTTTTTRSNSTQPSTVTTTSTASNTTTGRSMNRDNSTTSNCNAHLPGHVRLWLEQNYPQALGDLPPHLSPSTTTTSDVDDDNEDVVATGASAGEEAVNEDNDDTRRMKNVNVDDDDDDDDDFATQPQQAERQQPPGVADLENSDVDEKEQTTLAVVAQSESATEATAAKHDKKRKKTINDDDLIADSDEDMKQHLETHDVDDDDDSNDI